ncbi:hypothetical protein LINGRAHAP2_LOCUS24088 [Linum grandiflorum]
MLYQHIVMATLNGDYQLDRVVIVNHDQATTVDDGCPQQTVAEQITTLTISAPLPRLAFTNLATEPPPWGYKLYVVGTFLTKRKMNFHVIWYECLQTLYFICGILGHKEKHCKLRYNNQRTNCLVCGMTRSKSCPAKRPGLGQ